MHNGKQSMWPLGQYRRYFLTRLTQALIGLGALSFGLGGLAFLLPRKARPRPAPLVDILDEADLPRQGVKRVEFSRPAADGHPARVQRVFLVTKGESCFALSSRCTHLGCLVEWSRHRKRFVCPCHGGMYDDEGQVVQGPPPAPLTRLPVSIRDGRVYLSLEERRG